jgi:hypothetical protein
MPGGGVCIGDVWRVWDGESAMVGLVRWIDEL